MLFTYDIILADPTAVYTYAFHTDLLVGGNIVNVEGFCYFTFTDPNSDIISDICDHLRSQVYILVELSFPRIFK